METDTLAPPFQIPTPKAIRQVIKEDAAPKKAAPLEGSASKRSYDYATGDSWQTNTFCAMCGDRMVMFVCSKSVFQLRCSDKTCDCRGPRMDTEEDALDMGNAIFDQ